MSEMEQPKPNAGFRRVLGVVVIAGALAGLFVFGILRDPTRRDDIPSALQLARLQEARLQEARLHEARDQEARSKSRQDSGVALQEARLQEARLHEARLQLARSASTELDQLARLQEARE